MKRTNTKCVSPSTMRGFVNPSLYLNKGVKTKWSKILRSPRKSSCEGFTKPLIVRNAVCTSEQKINMSYL